MEKQILGTTGNMEEKRGGVERMKRNKGNKKKYSKRSLRKYKGK